MELAKVLKREVVSRLNPTPPWQLQPTQSVADAVRMMREKNVGCVLICADRQVLGIFTERDLLRRVLAPGLSLGSQVGQYMTCNPITVHPKDTISAAIKRMQKGGHRHLPVVVDGRAVGILSVKRIVHYLVEHFPATVYNLPPFPQFVQLKREGA